MYGGRGIGICKEWMEYTDFKRWAMVSGYKQRLTLERIDNNKGYSPINCRWANYKEQANNRRNNAVIEYDGQKKTLAMWADETGINLYTLWSRINKHGWPIEKALTAPAKRK